MASFSMHLAIAKLYLKTHSKEDIHEFIKGTLAPDLTDDKPATHYGRHSAWANPAKYLQCNGNDIENSFKKAYFLHLITDYIFYHKLIDIDEYIEKLGVDEWIRRQRTDFSILEDEITKKFEIEDMVEKLPDYIKNQMTKKQGELTIFERKSLYDFIENTSRIDIIKMKEQLLKNPDADLIKLSEETISK